MVGEADSFAALGNDSQKGNGKGQHGVLRLCLGMTGKNKQRQRQERLQVSPLRQTVRPFGFGRDDRSLFGRGAGAKTLLGVGDSSAG